MKRPTSRTLAYAGVLVALNVVLSRFVSVPVGRIFRISIGSVPVILSSLWLGSFFGGVTGFLGDLIGCAINGYAPNPFIITSAILTGVIPALFRPFLSIRNHPVKRYLRFVLVLYGMMMLTSQGLTVMGLSVLYHLPFRATWISRIPQTIALCLVNSFLCNMLYSRLRLPDEEHI